MAFLPTKERSKKITSLSIPIVTAMLSGNVLLIIDTFMVGYLGDKALAASGLAAMCNMLIMAAMTGLSPAVQALCARRLGEGANERVAIALNAGLVLGLSVGILVAVPFIFAVPALFPMLTPDADVAALGVPYFQWLLAALPLIGITTSFRGFWNGIGETGVYMKIVMLTQASNAFFNYVLIFGKFGFPELGLTGAGIGTVLALVVAAIAYLIVTLKKGREMGFLKGLPEKSDIQSVVKLSLPSSTHDLLFYGGFFVFFWMAGKVSTQALAATVVLARIKMISIMPGLGFGMGTATLVGQTLGGGDLKGASEWVFDVIKICFISLIWISIAFYFFDEQLLGLFIKDPETLAQAVLPLHLIALVLTVETGGHVFRFALFGAGDNARVMRYGFVNQWLFFLPLAWFLAVIQEMDLLGLWIAESVHGVMMVVVFGGLWLSGKWKSIKI